MDSSNKIHIELKNQGVVDNPFDVMLNLSLELTRELLFACHRLGNPQIPSCFCISESKINDYFEKIKGEFLTLLGMSSDTVALCRETSHYYSNGFDDVNEVLFKIKNSLPTVWSEVVPCRNLLFEKAKLGEGSDKYLRLLELRSISDELGVDCGYLHSLCDVISKDYNYIPEEVREKLDIIEKYNLSEDDIGYIISFRKSQKEG